MHFLVPFVTDLPNFNELISSDNVQDFLTMHSDYVALCDDVDAEFSSLFTDQPNDVVVDDKACAPRVVRA